MVEKNIEKLVLIEKIADILKEYNLTEIQYRFNDDKNNKFYINLKKEFSEVKRHTQIFQNEPNGEEKEKKDIKNTKNNDSEGTIIKSPMVGTVYLSPEPNSEPFVKEGDKIKEGDTILIIEAMKTMNQIPSTLDGTVKEILVNNESPVEFDTPLVIIEP